MKQIIEDPVEAKTRALEEKKLTKLKSAEAHRDIKPTPTKKDKKVKHDLEGSMEIGHLSTKDLKGLTPATVKISHPFAGYAYPNGKDATYIVAYIKPVAKDASGNSYSIRKDLDLDEYLDEGPYKGKTLNEVLGVDPKYAKEVITLGKTESVNLDTFHNRIIHNYESGRNEDVVFDRVIDVSDGEIRNCSKVMSHNVRAQLMYKIDPRTGNIQVDSNYALLDTAQAKRLLRIISNIAKPVKALQTLTDVIEGEATEDELPEEHQDLVEEG